MSGLAHIVLDRGLKVSGSDIQNSLIIEGLIKKGAVINIPHDKKNISHVDLVVYTSAVRKDNPEMVEAKMRNIPIMDRATFLGKIMKEHKYAIAVAGCHGKTTSTSMVSLVLKNANYDPTILLGGELDAIGGNVRIGKSPYFVTEACEYMENFLRFYPFIGVILNIGEDHLDYFKDINSIRKAFLKFAQLIPPEGFLILSSEDNYAMEIMEHVNCNIVTFGIDKNSTYMAKNIKYNNLGYPSFEVYKNKKNIGLFNLRIPGRHNILNALSTIAVCDSLSVSTDIINYSLLNFKGTHRRFEFKGSSNDITIIDDYAHHPTEIKVTLEAARKIPHKRIFCIFQPHTYTRTKLLLKEFAQSFTNADKIIITDIYAAREKDSGIVNSEDLTNAINKSNKNENAFYIKKFNEIAEYIAKKAGPGDLILTVGAGSITELGPIILNKLSKETQS